MTTVTKWCSLCVAEGRSSPGRVGRVETDTDGRVAWITENPRIDRQNKRVQDRPGGRWRGWRGFVVLRHPTVPVKVPDEVDALCRYHGHGRVSVQDVLHKRDNVVGFTATA